ACCGLATDGPAQTRAPAAANPTPRTPLARTAQSYSQRTTGLLPAVLACRGALVSDTNRITAACRDLRCRTPGPTTLRGAARAESMGSADLDEALHPGRRVPGHRAQVLVGARADERHSQRVRLAGRRQRRAPAGAGVRGEGALVARADLEVVREGAAVRDLEAQDPAIQGR